MNTIVNAVMFWKYCAANRLFRHWTPRRAIKVIVQNGIYIMYIQGDSEVLFFRKNNKCSEVGTEVPKMAHV